MKISYNPSTASPLTSGGANDICFDLSNCTMWIKGVQFDCRNYTAGTGLSLSDHEFSLKTATSSEIGGIIVDTSNFIYDTNGNIAGEAAYTNAVKKCNVHLTTSKQAFIAFDESDYIYRAGTGLTLLTVVDNPTITDNTFNLKTATTSEIGGIKPSNVLTSSVTLTSSNGTTANRYYGVQLDSTGKAFVNIPWSNTTYSAGTGLSLSSNKFSIAKSTASALGGVIVSNVLTTAVSLTSSNGSTASRYYGVQLDKDGKAFVNIPWTDTANGYVFGLTSDNYKLSIKVVPYLQDARLMEVGRYIDFHDNTSDSFLDYDVRFTTNAGTGTGLGYIMVSGGISINAAIDYPLYVFGKARINNGVRLSNEYDIGFITKTTNLPALKIYSSTANNDQVIIGNTTTTLAASNYSLVVKNGISCGGTLTCPTFSTDSITCTSLTASELDVTTEEGNDFIRITSYDSLLLLSKSTEIYGTLDGESYYLINEDEGTQTNITASGIDTPYITTTSGDIIANSIEVDATGFSIKGPDTISKYAYLFRNETTGGTNPNLNILRLETTPHPSGESGTKCMIQLILGHTGYSSTYASTTYSLVTEKGIRANGTLSYSSDITLKENFEDVLLDINDIAKAPIFNFTWKNDEYDKSKHLGSSAQYWKDITPYAVQGEEGEMGMSYAEIALASSVSIAKETIELKQKISNLESEIEQLRIELENVKNQ